MILDTSRIYDLGLNKYILCGKGDDVTFKAAAKINERLAEINDLDDETSKDVKKN